MALLLRYNPNTQPGAAAWLNATARRHPNSLGGMIALSVTAGRLRLRCQRRTAATADAKNAGTSGMMSNPWSNLLGSATMDSSAEIVVWRDGARRCELWVISGVAHLRVYDGDDLKCEEAVQQNASARAEDLRSFLPLPPKPSR
jgi:hypothetical protein